MDSAEKSFLRILFENKIYKSNGQAFEDLFVSIMRKADPGFISVKPQGNIGDRKNDGFNKSIGRYYQVYAPEDPKSSFNEAVKKLKTDFSGLKGYWQEISPINEYYFVFNDKYFGTNPTLEAELALIKNTHSLSECSVFICKHIESTVFSLPDDVIYSIVGHIPDLSKIQLLLYSTINDVISHILMHRKKLDYTQTLDVPDFNEKIAFNGLSNQVFSILQSASYHFGVLESYFDSNTDFIKQEIRDKLNDIYRSTLNENYGQIPNDKSIPDRRFFDILDKCTPNNNQSAQDATLIVMAYFFESCDIFEDPK